MSNEEFEELRDFILEQQAQFASGMQQLRETQRHTEQVLTRAGETVAQAGEIVAQAGEIVARLANRKLEGL